MATTNLFQTLYNSDAKRYVNSGYKCDSDLSENAEAVAEFGTDEHGEPTLDVKDANGDVIASQDLSGVSLDPVFEWESKSKVLQPGMNNFIQGPEFGESYMTEYYKIPLDLQSKEGWESFVDAEFDITYVNRCGCKATSHFKYTRNAGEETSIYEVIQNWLDCMEIPVCIDEELIDKSTASCCCCKDCSGEMTEPIDKSSWYLRMMSTSLGYDFIVNNLRFTPNYASEDFPNSPFSPEQITIQDVMQAISLVKPYKLSETKQRDPFTVDCSLYLYVLSNLDEGLQALDEFSGDGILEEDWKMSVYGGLGEKKNWVDIDSTEFLYNVYYPWDSTEPDENGIVHRGVWAVFKKIQELTGLNSTEPIEFPELYKLYEDFDLRVESMKYPNGAFRGISIVPQYPADFDGQKLSIKVNILKDFIYKLKPVLVKKDSETDGPLPEIPEIPSDTETPEIPLDPETLEGGLDEYIVLYKREKCRVIANGSKRVAQYADSSTGCHCHCNNWENAEVSSDMYQYVGLPDFGREDGKDYWAGISFGREDGKDYFWAANSFGGEDGKDYYWADNSFEEERCIGLEEYIDEVNKRNDWINVGQCFILMTQADSESTSTKNLCNSVIVSNPNPFPVKISIMTLD